MSLSASLRHATRDAHDRIEGAFDLPSRLATREAYRDLLARLLGFHTAFEAAVALHVAGTPFTAYLGRTALLATDLAVLGGGEAASGPPPVYGDLAEVLGGLYVVEGSILGGVLIASEVGRRLGIGPESGAGFFAGHGKATAATWRGFAAALDAAPVDDPAQAVAGAEVTYATMQAWLCPAPALAVPLEPRPPAAAAAPA